MQHLGDMSQFTLLASTSAAGDMLAHQVVFKGKTAGCFPTVSGVKYRPSAAKGCFKPEVYHEKSTKEKDVQALCIYISFIGPPGGCGGAEREP